MSRNNDRETSVEQLREKVRIFRDKRGWGGSDPKDMALSLVLEATELLEHFQWKSGDEVAKEARLKEAICDELADVLFWVLEMSARLEIDLTQAFERKMEKNEKKYPVEIFNTKNSSDEKRRAYYRIKAATRGGHPLAEGE